MTIVPQEQEQRFNLYELIGLLSPDGLIFQAPSGELSSLYDTDVFNTTLVLKKEPKEYDPHLLDYLFVLSTSINDQINQKRESYSFIDDPRQNDEYRALVKLHSPEKMLQIQRNFIEMLTKSRLQISEYGKEVVMAFPLWGSVAIMRAMEKEGLPQDSLIAASISGSVGTETGHAKADRLPEALLDPNKIVIFPDDIYDTCVTLIQLAIQRAKVKAELNGIRINHKIYSNPEEFEERMRLARNGKLSSEEQEQVWSNLAQLLWEVDVLSAPFSIKNPPFATAVIKLVADIQADPRSSDWERLKASMQYQLMQQTHHINPNHWIIGGKWDGIPLLDTKIRGKALLDELTERKDDYGITVQQIKKLREGGLKNLSLRAFAGLEGLWVYNPDGVPEGIDYSLLVQYFASHLADYVNHRWPTEIVPQQASHSLPS